MWLYYYLQLNIKLIYERKEEIIKIKINSCNKNVTGHKKVLFASVCPIFKSLGLALRCTSLMNRVKDAGEELQLDSFSQGRYWFDSNILRTNGSF